MFKKLKAVEVPKRKRTSIPRLAVTPDWKSMQAELEKGLTPGQAVEIILTPEERAKYHIKARRSGARFINQFLKARNLHKLYTFRSFNRGEDFYFAVSHETPVTKRRRA